MNKYIYNTLLIILVLLITGCVQQPQRITQTNSGLPEVEINSTNTSLIKSSIIDAMYQKRSGYMITNETDNSITFRKEAENGLGSAIAQSLMVGSYGQHPKIEVVYTLSKRPNSTNVYGVINQVYIHSNGSVEKIDSTQNNTNFNGIYSFLTSIKSKIEIIK